MDQAIVQIPVYLALINAVDRTTIVQIGFFWQNPEGLEIGFA